MSQPRHWASACGWDSTRVTASSATPGAAASTNRTGICTSATIRTPGSAISASTVVLTEPSTEFSTGTRPASTRPAATSATTAATVVAGTVRPTRWGSRRVACSVKVPSGPR